MPAAPTAPVRLYMWMSLDCFIAGPDDGARFYTDVVACAAEARAAA